MSTVDEYSDDSRYVTRYRYRANILYRLQLCAVSSAWYWLLQ